MKVSYRHACAEAMKTLRQRGLSESCMLGRQVSDMGHLSTGTHAQQQPTHPCVLCHACTAAAIAPKCAQRQPRCPCVPHHVCTTAANALECFHRGVQSARVYHTMCAPQQLMQRGVHARPGQLYVQSKFIGACQAFTDHW
eukprot:1150788-Pelagomonas_calceolata.AAC.2